MRNILYISYFKSTDPARNREFAHCLQKNIENKFIDKIVVLFEGDIKDFPELFVTEKVKLIESPRPTFQDLFDIANIISRPEDNTIISNTDIYFDETIGLIKNYNLNNTCLALSRYQWVNSENISLHNEKFSQDTWIFQGRIKTMAYATFFLGIPGCDNRIAYEIHLTGYNIINPAYTIRSIHYHLSDDRNYTPGKIQKPYLAVPVTSLP